MWLSIIGRGRGWGKARNKNGQSIVGRYFGHPLDDPDWVNNPDM